MAIGTRLNDEYKKILEERYNVLGYFHFLDFDFDFDLLREKILSLKKNMQGPNDKFVFLHIDIDFYQPGGQVGHSIYNLFKLFHECDISTRHIFFITNHHGIEKEFRLLIGSNFTDYELPTFFYQLGDSTKLFSTCLKHAQEININDNVQSISKHGLALLGRRRVHRNALYQYIKENNLFDKIAVSYNNKQT